MWVFLKWHVFLALQTPRHPSRPPWILLVWSSCQDPSLGTWAGSPIGGLLCCTVIVCQMWQLNKEGTHLFPSTHTWTVASTVSQWGGDGWLLAAHTLELVLLFQCNSKSRSPDSMLGWCCSQKEEEWPLVSVDAVPSSLAVMAWQVFRPNSLATVALREQ
jgi:hypothetical protein